MKDIKKNQRQILEPKVIKTKHSLDKLSGRMKMTEKILVNWKNYPVESSNLKNRERVDRKKKKKKTEQNPRDHRYLGNNSKSNIHMIRVPEKKSKPENKLCDISIRIDI